MIHLPSGWPRVPEQNLESTINTFCCGPWTHRALGKGEMEDKLGWKLMGKTETVYFYITNGFWEPEIPRKSIERRTGFSRCHGDLTCYLFLLTSAELPCHYNTSLWHVTPTCHSDTSLQHITQHVTNDVIYMLTPSLNVISSTTHLTQNKGKPSKSLLDLEKMYISPWEELSFSIFFVKKLSKLKCEFFSVFLFKEEFYSENHKKIHDVFWYHQKKTD